MPELESKPGKVDSPEAQEKEDLFEAAYEDVTFRDSADDDHEGEVFDLGEPRAEFELAADAGRLVKRLHFLSTLAQLLANRRPRNRKGPSPPEGRQGGVDSLGGRRAAGQAAVACPSRRHS